LRESFVGALSILTDLSPALTEVLSTDNVLSLGGGDGGRGCSISSSHVPGISATGSNQVAVSITPFPEPKVSGSNVMDPACEQYLCRKP
jgi:hypothetical protein